VEYWWYTTQGRGRRGGINIILEREASL